MIMWNTSHADSRFIAMKVYGYHIIRENGYLNSVLFDRSDIYWSDICGAL